MLPVTSIVRNSDGSWTFAWQDQGQSYSRVVLWGIELERTNTLSYTWDGQEYRTFPPPLEIAYEDQQAPSEQFQPYLIMQWYGEACQEYLVQKFTGSAWATIARLQEDGQWIYTYQTVILADETLYEYRVVAVDEVNNLSNPQLYTRYVVCPPVPPELSISYNAGNIVISS